MCNFFFTKNYEENCANICVKNYEEIVHTLAENSEKYCEVIWQNIGKKLKNSAKNYIENRGFFCTILFTIFERIYYKVVND